MLNIEEMSMNAWPSIRSAVYRGCLLRQSNGYTNRANSANPLYSNRNDFAEIVQYAERFYGHNGQPCVFKILKTERYAELDALLERGRYETVTPTIVMKCDLANFDRPGDDTVLVESSFSDTWFRAFVRHNQTAEKNADTAWKMLNLIAVDVIVASVIVDGEIAACGYGALESGFVGFFDIVVDGEKRGKGYGRALMNGIIDEAKRRGARTGYLQVLENNGVARNLYASLGFNEYYAYWYRKKELYNE
jgi:GNAT superfamily N-acetyltransferase